MTIREAQPSVDILEKLIALSADWEAECSTHGYRKNGCDDIAGNRVFLAAQDGEILGYLFGKEEKAKRSSSVIADGTPYFEIEELYVVPSHRSEGIGKALFSFVEQTVKAEGLGVIMLSTATKDHKRILHFYIEELGMDFWSARLFKKLQ